VKLRIATCRQLPEPDVDAEPLAAALRDAGVEAELLAWDDPAADWDAPIPTLLRSTWNYALQLDAFLAWLERVSKAAPLLNPADIVRANVRKRYLLELAAHKVPVIATTLVKQGRTIRLPASRLVIKPEVGAGSLHTKVFEPGDPAAAEHLAELTRTGAALIQRYLASVEGYGERCLVWIDGELSHAVRKARRFAGDLEQITGPFDIAHDERVVAEAALAPYRDRILYGRVDLARDDRGQPRVMEVELIEPSLFFGRRPDAAARFVAGLVRKLRA
jgi:glutathione synthase/RimK-type ligase-like ATP-grasp enzyme